ncbi:hypothetical protein HanPI659440_Chr05g0192421 [Helianthus annuus]|nr:hypothetical protein HanPI659440_Chr05g0192421 [Helianthus annuus]
MVTGLLLKREKTVSPRLAIPSCRPLHIQRSGRIGLSLSLLHCYLSPSLPGTLSLPSRMMFLLNLVSKSAVEAYVREPYSFFQLPSGHIGNGRFELFYPSRLKAFLGGNSESFAGCCFFCSVGILGVSFVVEGIENQEMGVVPWDGVPRVEGQEVEWWRRLGDSLSCKCKSDLVVGAGKVVPEVRNIPSRLRIASNKKSQPTSQTMSEALPIADKVPLSKHLKVLRPSSNLVSRLSLGPSRLRFLFWLLWPCCWLRRKVKMRMLYLSKLSSYFPSQVSVQSRFHFPSSSRVQSPLALLFAEGYSPPYVPSWNITFASIISTGEIAPDFMSHALTPSQKFMNAVLDPQVFEDQCYMAMCDNFLGVLGCYRVFKR